MPLVRDFMSAKVFTVRFDKKLLAAGDVMKWAHVRHVPVVDEQGAVVGLISHRDLLQASMSTVKSGISDAEKRQHLWSVPIEKVMHKPVKTIGPGATVQEAAKTMRNYKIGCLPVVDGGKLVGILTGYDLLHLVETL